MAEAEIRVQQPAQHQALPMSILKPPRQLDMDTTNLPDHWRKWKEELTLYMELAMIGKPEDLKLKLFKYLIGPQGREIYSTLEFDQAEQDRNLNDVLAVFDRHCDPKKDETVERYHFFTRNQESESFDKYLTDLRILAATCNFGELHDSLIRDRIVCGISEIHLRERLLREADLTLDKCVHICRASEISKKQSLALNAQSAVHAVSNKSDPKQKARKSRNSKSSNSKQTGKSGKQNLLERPCNFCGLRHEKRRHKCPAYGKEFNACHSKSHFSSMCHSLRNLNFVSETLSSEEEDYFEINTVNFTSETLCLNSVNGQSFPKRIFATMLVKVSKNTSESTHSPITLEQLKKQYRDVFQGTGLLEGKYKIDIDPAVTPVVHPPRKVPVALRDKLKSELQRLTDLNIIAPVTDPTPWVSSMVLVSKPNKLRICIDPKDLNQAIRRSHHPIPTIEDILPELTKAKIFSTLDAKNGFWHVELDEESSYLTTFNTPFGWYRWCRLPFGISSAPEVFELRQEQALEGLKCVKSIHDDILLYGEGDTYEEASRDHDRNLENLMERCREKNTQIEL
ncbi:uncharacterized protein LOC135478234 [Liolophura sinensis]|uniref:uncharacterized protein LOC135478234 n=1 Tax=Liolophura sinensis TaxID=3198878 RepID=UPI003158CE5E